MKQTLNHLRRVGAIAAAAVAAGLLLVSGPASAQQPGKILHELRGEPLAMPGEGIVLPPVYYGTVDATALWVCLLGDAARIQLSASHGILGHREANMRNARHVGRRCFAKDQVVAPQAACLNPPILSMNDAISSMPRPLRASAKMNGRSPRIRLASRSITSRLAPT